MNYQNNSVDIFTGPKQRPYYRFQHSQIAYDISYPIQHAFHAFYNHYGHQHCMNCLVYGTYNHIAISLCANCTYICNKNNNTTSDCSCNSNGSLQKSIDDACKSYEDDGIFALQCNSKSCIHVTYLKDIDFHTLQLSPVHYQQFRDTYPLCIHDSKNQKNISPLTIIHPELLESNYESDYKDTFENVLQNPKEEPELDSEKKIYDLDLEQLIELEELHEKHIELLLQRNRELKRKKMLQEQKKNLIRQIQNAEDNLNPSLFQRKRPEFFEPFSV